MNTKLVSSKSQTNYSSGYYTLFFDENNILSMLFQGPDPYQVSTGHLHGVAFIILEDSCTTTAELLCLTPLAASPHQMNSSS